MTICTNISDVSFAIRVASVTFMKDQCNMRGTGSNPALNFIAN